MFKKSIEAIIAEGQKNLQELTRQTEDAALRAKDEVKRCSSEIAGNYRVLVLVEPIS